MASLSDELKIVISGDPKKFNKALDEALAGTKRLEAGASAVAKVSGVAFAALTGTVVGLVAAFREQEVQEQKTTALLKAQGDQAQVTAGQVFEMAAALQKVTIFGDDAILSAQNMLLGLANLSEQGLKKASMATLDLATFMGSDATSAAQQLGKALANPAEGLSALGRAGIKFTDDQERVIKALAQTGQTAAAQNMILDIMNGKIGGLATAATDGSGKIIQLKDVIGDIGEEIGRNLVPTLSKAAEVALPFVRALSENAEFAKTAAALLLIGTAVTGAVAAFALGTVAVIKWNALMKAANLSTLALSFSIRGALITTGIGVLLVVITDLALNWDKRMQQMASAWTAFKSVFVDGAKSIGQILIGIVTQNFKMVGDGLKGLTSAGTSFADAYSKSMAKYAEANMDAADGTAVVQKDKETKGKLVMQNQLYLEQMKKLDDDYTNQKLEAQLSANEQEQLVNAEHRNAIVEANNEFRAALVESQVSDQTIDVEQELQFQTDMQEMRNEMRAAEINAVRAAALEKQQLQQKADLQYLKDREKFGVAFARINKIINSEYVQGAGQAAGELVALQQSTNATLKSIGKAAAIADITIKTAQSAMNIYTGFSTIPIVGPALGVAGAVAAVAFGAERISQVTRAADGGRITGPGGPRSDIIPAALSNGEFVTPAKNYNETVNAVAQQRLAEQGFSSAGAGGGRMDVVIGFQDDAFRIIEEKLNERRRLEV